MASAEPLQAYRQKRDFKRTPEPPPGKVRKGEHGLYVIQKHAASHLHYDFRLELGGVLKSWAVPKGPSCDPHEKRLARHVEDHPIEYGEFEGIIPKGQYGGGTVLLWDRGRWEPVGDPVEGYEKGKLKFQLHGEKLRGGFTLVRMRSDDGKRGDENWLLIKERDAMVSSGDIVAERPESVLTGRSIEEIAADPAAAEWHSNRAPAEEKPRSKGRAAVQEVRKAVQRQASSAPVPGAVRAPMPEALDLQLATLVTDPPSGEGWIYEVKLDGYRLLAFLEDGKARLVTRKEQDWTHRFPTVAAQIADLPAKNAVIDGELVALRPDGVSDFQTLQSAIHDRREPSLVYFAFDLLHLDGHDLRGAALSARKQALSALLRGQEPGGGVRYSDHVESEGSAVFNAACKLGAEGILAKQKDAPYRAGRVGSWLKVKCHMRQEVVVGGFTDPSGSRAGLGALLIGYHDGSGKLLYAGKVGTGFSHELLLELRARLAKMEIRESPFEGSPRVPGAHWIEPHLVAEVRFAGFTRVGRVRQAAFLGLREDKDAKSVVREAPKAPVSAEAKPRETPKETAAAKTKRREAPKEMAAPKTEHASLERQLSHPDKVLYPEQGITKRALAEYYARIAPRMLPFVARRPLTLVRCPEGQGKPCFFQKHAGQGLGGDVRRIAAREEDGEQVYLYIDSAAGLVSLVQMGALEIHAWGSHVETIEKPDLLVFDLDPGPGVPWAETVTAARTVRTLLDALGLASFVKTTGGKGLHVVLPLRPTLTWDEAKEFAKSVAATLEKADPNRYVATMSKAKRNGKVFVDYLRNGRGATAIAPYSTRARPGGLVAMPISWEELESVEPSAFGIATAPEWLEKRGDPWAGLLSVEQTVTAAMRKKLAPGRG